MYTLQIITITVETPEYPLLLGHSDTEAKQNPSSGPLHAPKCIGVISQLPRSPFELNIFQLWHPGLVLACE